MIVASIGLLFAQANFDLAIPDYLSNIVNVGIQQGGVENSVPKAMREIEMNRTLLFLTPDNKTEVKGVYKLVRNATSEADNYKNEYPAVLNQSIYILTNSDAAEITFLNPIMARTLLAVLFIRDVVMTNKTLLLILGIQFRGIPFPPGTDLFAYLQTNSTALEAIMARSGSEYSALGDSMIIQAATAEVFGAGPCPGHPVHHCGHRQPG